MTAAGEPGCGTLGRMSTEDPGALEAARRQAEKALEPDRPAKATRMLTYLLEDLVPIPGTRRIATLEQNAAAADIVLTPEDLAAIEAVFPKDAASGHRYAEAARAALNR